MQETCSVGSWWCRCFHGTASETELVLELLVGSTVGAALVGVCRREAKVELSPGSSCPAEASELAPAEDPRSQSGSS